MARSRKRTPSRRRFKRRADWVFRGNTYDQAGALIDDAGSYVVNETTILPGVPNAQPFILYDSHDRIVQTVSSGINVPVLSSASGRAEGRRAFIHWCKGTMFYRPSAWAAGNAMSFGLRFGIYEQDPATGALLIDPAYTLFSTPGITTLGVSHWANDGQWQKERRIWVAFNDNSQRMSTSFSFPVRRSLPANMCYAIFAEVNNQPAESVNVILRPFFQTLVSDEG